MKQNDFFVTIHKCSSISVDDKVHKVPNGLGMCSEYRVADYFCPDEWSKDGVFLELKENDCFYLRFYGNQDCACIPSIQKVNPLTGDTASTKDGLTKDPKQNYVKLPEQEIIFGYYNNGVVYQFVVTKSGIGTSVSENVLPYNMQDSHAIGLAFYKTKYKTQQNINNYNYYRYKPLWYYNYYDTYPLWDSGSCYFEEPLIGGYPNFLDSEFNTKNTIRLDNNERRVESPNTQFVGNISSCSISNSNADFHDSCQEIEPPYQYTYTDKAAIGAGGRVCDNIFCDYNSIDFYEENPSAILNIYICLPEQFCNIIGRGKRQQPVNRDNDALYGEMGGKRFPLIRCQIPCQDH